MDVTQSWLCRCGMSLISAALLFSGCRSAGPVIAVIPRTSGTMMWETEHRGAFAAAVQSGAQIYWNSPTREDDVQGQIALVEHVSDGGYQGLVLAPDHALALLTPVRRALARGIPTVIVGSPLMMPSTPRLGYVLNDEQASGQMAARRVGAVLHGHGSIAVLGIDPGIAGIMTRAHVLEQTLSREYPQIHIVTNRLGSFNVPHEQQVAEETLKSYPEIDAVVTLTSTSTYAMLSALSTGSSGKVRVIGFDPNSLGFDSPNLDSFIVQDVHGMGAAAVRMIVASLHGQPMVSPIRFRPLLVTRENVNSPQVQNTVSTDWHPASMRWKWSIGP
jgi:ribose transport system substrate-binding protein